MLFKSRKIRQSDVDESFRCGHVEEILQDSNSNSNFYSPLRKEQGGQIAISNYCQTGFTAKYGKTIPWPSLRYAVGWGGLVDLADFPSLRFILDHSLVVRRNKNKSCI
jgi:hypothetical protein